jgi:hypothetical protein
MCVCVYFTLCGCVCVLGGGGANLYLLLKIACSYIHTHHKLSPYNSSLLAIVSKPWALLCIPFKLCVHISHKYSDSLAFYLYHKVVRRTLIQHTHRWKKPKQNHRSFFWGATMTPGEGSSVHTRQVFEVLWVLYCTNISWSNSPKLVSVCTHVRHITQINHSLSGYVCYGKF